MKPGISTVAPAVASFGRRAEMAAGEGGFAIPARTACVMNYGHALAFSRYMHYHELK